MPKELPPAKNLGLFDKIVWSYDLTSNVNFEVRPVLQLVVIALCAFSQPLNRKIT